MLLRISNQNAAVTKNIARVWEKSNVNKASEKSVEKGTSILERWKKPVVDLNFDQKMNRKIENKSAKDEKSIEKDEKIEKIEKTMYKPFVPGIPWHQYGSQQLFRKKQLENELCAQMGFEGSQKTEHLRQYFHFLEDLSELLRAKNLSQFDNLISAFEKSPAYYLSPYL